MSDGEKNWLAQTAILVLIGVVVVSGVVGAAVSAENAVVIIGFCGVVCASLFSTLQANRASAKADEASAKVEAVAVAAEVRGVEIVARAEKAAVQVAEVAVKAEEAAAAVAEVVQVVSDDRAKTTEQLEGLAVAVAETKKTGESIHILVNSSMSYQLKVAMLALRRIAGFTKGTPVGEEDEAAAQQAEKLYREHEEKQGLVDEKDAREGKAK